MKKILRVGAAAPPAPTRKDASEDTLLVNYYLYYKIKLIFKSINKIKDG